MYSLNLNLNSTQKTDSCLESFLDFSFQKDFLLLFPQFLSQWHTMLRAKSKNDTKYELRRLVPDLIIIEVVLKKY